MTSQVRLESSASPSKSDGKAVVAPPHGRGQAVGTDCDPTRVSAAPIPSCGAPKMHHRGRRPLSGSPPTAVVADSLALPASPSRTVSPIFSSMRLIPSPM